MRMFTAITSKDARSDWATSQGFQNATACSDVQVAD